jgi:hypothetical protein
MLWGYREHLHPHAILDGQSDTGTSSTAANIGKGKRSGLAASVGGWFSSKWRKKNGAREGAENNVTDETYESESSECERIKVDERDEAVGNRREVMFDIEMFIAEAPEDERSFHTVLLHTKAFANFVQCRVFGHQGGSGSRGGSGDGGGSRGGSGDVGGGRRGGGFGVGGGGCESSKAAYMYDIDGEGRYMDEEDIADAEKNAVSRKAETQFDAFDLRCRFHKMKSRAAKRALLAGIGMRL